MYYYVKITRPFFLRFFAGGSSVSLVLSDKSDVGDGDGDRRGCFRFYFCATYTHTHTPKKKSRLKNKFRTCACMLVTQKRIRNKRKITLAHTVVFVFTTPHGPTCKKKKTQNFFILPRVPASVGAPGSYLEYFFFFKSFLFSHAKELKTKKNQQSTSFQCVCYLCISMAVCSVRVLFHAFP